MTTSIMSLWFISVFSNVKLYKSKSSGIFNIGSGQAINIKQIADLIGKKYKKKINFIDNDEITYLVSNNSKILKKNVKLKSIAKLVDQSWLLKKTFSKRISNKKIDNIYTHIIKKGAYGAKLLGAGNAGFILFFSGTFF